jgi:hypothetical protein
MIAVGTDSDLVGLGDRPRCLLRQHRRIDAKRSSQPGGGGDRLLADHDEPHSRRGELRPEGPETAQREPSGRAVSVHEQKEKLVPRHLGQQLSERQWLTIDGRQLEVRRSGRVDAHRVFLAHRAQRAECHQYMFVR